MSGLAPGSPFPPLQLSQAGGQALDWKSLRGRHRLVLPASSPAEALALNAQARDREAQLRWLELACLAVFPGLPSGWPAGEPAWILQASLPQGLSWGQAYLVSKRGSLLGVQVGAKLDWDALEKDLLYWEAGHCLS